MLTHQRDIRLTLSTSLWLTRMLRTIEHVHLSRHSLCRNQVRILGHITRSVDLALVVDFLDDLNAWLGWYGVTTEFSAFIIVV